VSPPSFTFRSMTNFGAPPVLVGALLLCALALLGAGCAGLGPGAERELDVTAPSIDAAAIDSEFRSLLSRPDGVPHIRVGLARGVERTRVTSSGALAVTVYADSTMVRRLEPGESVVVVGGESRLRVEGPGFEASVALGTVRVAPVGAAPLAHDGTGYRGEIEVFAHRDGTLSVVNVIDIESYLRGVVPLEIGPRPPADVEAVKAQAIAARTYALATGGRRADHGVDVLSTVADQVYGGVDAEDSVADFAILETAGKVLMHDGAPASAYFHASCGGRTEARDEVWELGPEPYLRSVWDTPGGRSDRETAYCAEGPHFDWTEEWSGREIEDIVGEHLPATASTPVRGPIDDVRDIRIAERTPSGRVRWLAVDTDAGEYRVFGDRVRWLLRRPGSGSILRSSWFDLEVERRGGRVRRVRAVGRGNGHGVGMCQHGALGMARRGYDFREILGHYYPGARLSDRYASRQRPAG